MMDLIRLGIVGASDIAKKRFLPALLSHPKYTYIGTASRNIQKAKNLTGILGGRAFEGYESIIESPLVDAVYISLPPSLHYVWANKALQCGKHVFLEKPATVNHEHTKDLVYIAGQKNLALYENYAFVHHPQFQKIKDLLAQNTIGELRQIRTAFGFPKRLPDDFRYTKELGGGALFDCGGYCIKLATQLLGTSTHVDTASFQYTDQGDVDIFGNMTLRNQYGISVQGAFGMDNSYQCQLELWGSKGYIQATRFFTAPPSLTPPLLVSTIEGGSNVIDIETYDQFSGSLDQFYFCIHDPLHRETTLHEILVQSELTHSIWRFQHESSRAML